MQLIKANRDALLKPLTTVAGIVERRHTLPILANILIQKRGSRVSFIATDLEVQITATGEFGIGDEDAAVTVAARKLLDILRALPDNEEITLSQSTNKLTVQCGKSRFSLQTLAAQEFPTLTEPDIVDVSVTLAQKTLKHLFGMTHYAMAQQDIRYYLNGTLMVFESDTLRAVATDGHRLAHCSCKATGVQTRSEIILPRKTVLELQRLLEDSDQSVTVDVGAGQVRFRFEQVELISKLVEGKFPDYKRVIPTNYDRHFDVSREDLLASLQRASILSTDKLRSVRFQLADNTLTASSTNAEQEEALEQIEIDYSYEPLDVGFNVSYLLDFLSSIKNDTVRWSVMPDANASALLTLPEDDSFQYVVMPMRI
ncbi:MAG: DNA polymerase III subunit beta [Burkholderiaceae bacterium]|nr:DNA polymerase III subunit beta [Burkholderiaceae bacterium]MCD8537978.1 DNA polymerase III subunit beta [Burkholderiaceae bacterium]